MRITIGLIIEDGKSPPWVTKGGMAVVPERLVPAAQEMMNEFLRAWNFYDNHPAQRTDPRIREG